LKAFRGISNKNLVLKAHYLKKIAESKIKKEAIICLVRMLTNLIFGIMILYYIESFIIFSTNTLTKQSTNNLNTTVA